MLSWALALCLVAFGNALTLHAAMAGARTLRCCELQQPPHMVACSSGSWSIVEPGELDMALLREWVGEMLQSSGMSIRGMAGVLSIYCADEKFVFRGAHLHGAVADLEGEFVDAWSKDEARESKLVLKGSNLDHEALERGLRKCVISPATLERIRKSLRFDVGDPVECLTRSGWSNATVVDLLYRDETMPPGLVAPYQLRLEEDGAPIFAPEDSREVVRARRLERLRFAVDDVVECNLGERWAQGVVVDLMYREAGMASGVAAPYQVELGGGTLIYVPSDSKAVIRKPRGRLFNLLSL
jgi:hypothetical protein